MKKIPCPKCSREITANNFKKHTETCNGTYFTGPNRPVVSVWTEEKRIDHLVRIREIKKEKSPNAWNKGLSKEDPRVAQAGIKNSLKHRNGEVDYSTIRSEEYRKNQSEKAKARGLGGYQATAGRGKKSYRIDSSGRTVCLQSSYESLLADLLEFSDIQWVRPEHGLKYLNGTRATVYHPDFYLPEYNIYLDTKNNYLAVKDEPKIAMVIEQTKEQIFIILKHQIEISYIKSIMVR